jgi:hypothetical protein
VLDQRGGRCQLVCCCFPRHNLPPALSECRLILLTVQHLAARTCPRVSRWLSDRDNGSRWLSSHLPHFRSVSLRMRMGDDVPLADSVNHPHRKAYSDYRQAQGVLSALLSNQMTQCTVRNSRYLRNAEGRYPVWTFANSCLGNGRSNPNKITAFCGQTKNALHSLDVYSISTFFGFCKHQLGEI